MRRTKYIFVSGGVISGIGKGVTAASLGYLLQKAGYKVAPLKFENYLNVDAGTINPIEHGDPFLCEDGTEADMDLGTYEKFLGIQVGKFNYVTTGSIFKAVIDRERRFEYRGEDVEVIPHVTNEIISRIYALKDATKADIILIELGGTVGEYGNSLNYEAARQLKQLYPQDVVHVHVSYVPTPGHLGEPKTKPTQLSVRLLNGMGIQPDILIARSSGSLDKRRIERLSMFCGVEPEAIFNNPDVESVYTLPLLLEKQEVTRVLLKKLRLPFKKPQLSEVKTLLSHIEHSKKGPEITIAIVGKYFKTGEYVLRDSYAALFDALDHAAWQLQVKLKTRWISAEEVEEKGVGIIGKPQGIIVPIGWGERGAEGMIAAAGYARDKNIPYLGLCYGMQLAFVSFARDVMGLTDANTEENCPDATHCVIHIIESQKKHLAKKNYGASMRLGRRDAYINPSSQSYVLYKKAGMLEKKGIVSERHRHRYEFNSNYKQQAQKAGLIIAAESVEEGLVEIIELPKERHPFYIATQGHPEYKSYPFKPHPLFVGFLKAALEESKS